MAVLLSTLECAHPVGSGQRPPTQLSHTAVRVRVGVRVRAEERERTGRLILGSADGVDGRLQIDAYV